MHTTSPKILVYITDNKDRVLSGSQLTLYICDPDERQKCVVDLSRALRASVLELKNGDYLLIGT